MTKQDEIREGTAKWLFDTDYQFTAQWEDAQPFLKAEYCKKADDFLSYLHSQGVVIKVEGRLPNYITWDFEDRKKVSKIQGDMLKAGYVAVEPLIEGEV